MNSSLASQFLLTILHHKLSLLRLLQRWQTTNNLKRNLNMQQPQPFRISPARSLAKSSQLLQLINKVLLIIIAKLRSSNPPESTRSIAQLPQEIILLIAGMLELHDRASLCLVSRDFKFILGNTLQSLKHDEVQRHDFLCKFDQLNPSWLLCLRCTNTTPGPMVIAMRGWDCKFSAGSPFLKQLRAPSSEQIIIKKHHMARP